MVIGVHHIDPRRSDAARMSPVGFNIRGQFFQEDPPGFRIGAADLSRTAARGGTDPFPALVHGKALLEFRTQVFGIFVEGVTEFRRAESRGDPPFAHIVVITLVIEHVQTVAEHVSDPRAVPPGEIRIDPAVLKCGLSPQLQIFLPAVAGPVRKISEGLVGENDSQFPVQKFHDSVKNAAVAAAGDDQRIAGGPQMPFLRPICPVHPVLPGEIGFAQIYLPSSRRTAFTDDRSLFPDGGRQECG